MNDIKTLKLYSKNRKLPLAVKLGTLSADWVSYAQQFALELTNTSDVALAQRNAMQVKGTEVDNYDSLTEFYNQRYFSEMQLPSEISNLEGVHHLRFGVLEKDGVIPFHLDEPFTFRFNCIIRGSHNFHFENNNTYEMKAGELWFINGSFKHSIENTSQDTRIALLGKFSNNQNTIRMINELL